MCRPRSHHVTPMVAFGPMLGLSAFWARGHGSVSAIIRERLLAFCFERSGEMESTSRGTRLDARAASEKDDGLTQVLADLQGNLAVLL